MPPFRLRQFVFMLTALTALLVARALAAPCAAPCAAPPKQDEPVAYLVVEITQLLRGPAPAELRDRRDALVAQIESAGSAQARALRKDLKKLEAEMKPLRSFVLDGWSSPARENGTLRRTVKSMRVVLLPSSERNRAALRRAKPGDFFLIGLESARDLFVNEGRRYTRATDARAVDAPDDWIPNRPWRVPPARPNPNGARGIEISISHPRVSEAKNGHDLYRHSVRIEAPAMNDRKRVLQVWYHVYVETTDGEVIGPLPASGEYVDKDGGGLTVNRGWELVQLEGGPKLDLESTRVELIASRWSNRMSS